MSEPRLYFMHRRFDHRPMGGVTLCFTLTEDVDFPDDYLICFAEARCSLEDHFSKVIGRNIARGRYRVGKTTSALVGGVSDYREARRKAVVLLEGLCAARLKDIQERWQHNFEAARRRFDREYCAATLGRRARRPQAP